MACPATILAKLLRASRAPGSVIVVAIAAACATAPPVGSVAADDALLSETTSLAYVARAMGRADARARDLFDDDVPLVAAPDPTPALVAAAAVNPTIHGGTTLRVATWNVGLLDTRAIVPGLPTFHSPALAARRRVVPHLILLRGFDVVLLQEVWAKQDLRRVLELADAYGYAAQTGPRDRYDDGLVTLVKRALIVDDGRRAALRFDAQEPLEALLGPQIERGALSWSFTARGIGPVQVWNTHFQSLPSYWRERLAQARQLGLAVDAAAADALLIVGGDVNAGPYYRLPSWTQRDGYVVDRWWQNALTYPALLHYGRLVDLVVRGRGPSRAVDDVRYGQLVQSPLPADFCDRVPVDAFTATDCNGLYRRQYGGDEAPARIDHLFARDDHRRVHVARTGVWYDAPMRLGGEDVEPSDHAAVFVELVVAGLSAR